MTITYQDVRDAYTTIRAMERMTIGCAVIGAIVGSIVFDVWLQHAKEPLLYVATTAHAEVKPKEVQIRVVVNWTRERIDKEIESKAKEYGVSAALMHKIIACESNYDIDAQSHHMLSYGREESYGLVQIHLPSHPTITYEQAIDPAFSIDFLAKNIAKGKARLWSCYRMVR